MPEYRFVYLVGVIGALALWSVIFVIRKDLRKEMALMSSIVGILGVTQAVYAAEYWSPSYALPLRGLPFGFEDFLLAGFLYGGIGSVLYQSVTNSKYICSSSPHGRSTLVTWFMALGVGCALFLVGEYLLEINSIYTTMVALLGSAAVLALFNPLLRKAMFFNGVLFGVLAVIGIWTLNLLFPGYVENTWNINALSGLLVAGVPIEEFLFHFAAGVAFAVVYETLYSCRILKSSL